MFRSYRPLDEELKKSSVPLAEPEEVDQNITKELGRAGEPPVLEEIVRTNQITVFHRFSRLKHVKNFA